MLIPSFYISFSIPPLLATNTSLHHTPVIFFKQAWLKQMSVMTVNTDSLFLYAPPSPCCCYFTLQFYFFGKQHHLLCIHKIQQKQVSHVQDLPGTAAKKLNLGGQRKHINLLNILSKSKSKNCVAKSYPSHQFSAQSLIYSHLPLFCLQIQELIISVLVAILKVENYVSCLSPVTPYYASRLTFSKTVPAFSLTALILYSNSCYSGCFPIMNYHFPNFFDTASLK